MHAWSVAKVKLARALAIVIAVLVGTGVAHAQGFDFNTFLSGGGGGADPVKQQLVRGYGAYVCLRVAPGSSPDSVTFTIWSRIPQPRATVIAVAFDMGQYKSLFSGMSVAFATPGVKANPIPAQPHAFLPRMKPDFWFEIERKGGHVGTEGLRPGRMLALSARLSAGKTIADVMEALQVGLNRATGPNGLRVGIIVQWMLGGPPPGVATIMDDGGFLVTQPSELCL